MSLLSANFTDWLAKHADTLDQSNQHSAELLTKIANEGIFRLGVPAEFGGDGKSIFNAIQGIEALAQYSLTAAFISWGHRTLIENLIASANPIPRQLWLAELLSGKRAGGTGLSNAVKFLSGVEELQVTLSERGGKKVLNGRLPWVTNLQAGRFVAIFAAAVEGSNQSVILTIPSEADGLSRSDDLEFIALQGSNTAALTFENVELNPDWIISSDANHYLAQIRPAFLGLQCGMPFGLAKRCLAEVAATLASNRAVLQQEWQTVSQRLAEIEQQLAQGLAEKDYFIRHPKALFQLRIDIVDVVAQSVLLELQTGGGRGYLKHGGLSFARRWREAAFLPIVTPSAVQLRLVLANSK
ncbi:dehydrogenase [[Actinobacillus] muris]|uniref:Dehydrogenase n=1 Tax=Muribacter muris TaxID=67855 RepID=A0A0J5P881_9PAST|nr:acyl-CoA dehydrogenase family protein [Muribacter muris]KMK52441.1 dehydrogenase [[Actinobacillus] muris] [Muribacter muris]